jgi:hypothetical protein
MGFWKNLKLILSFFWHCFKGDYARYYSDKEMEKRVLKKYPELAEKDTIESDIEADSEADGLMTLGESDMMMPAEDLDEDCP